MSRYGILFFALVLSAGCQATEASPVLPAQVTIAFPEGTGLTAESGAGQVARSLALEGLTSLAPDGRPTARLASEWKWLDETTLQVTMLPGLTFHNGEKLDAARAATIFREFVKSSRQRERYPALTDVTSIEARSDTELVFTLARHSWWLPEDLSITLNIAQANKTPIGTGPYQIVEDNESGRLLQRFERYHAGKAGIPRVTVRTESTLRTAWASLLRGDVDVVVDLPPDTVELIQNESVRIMAFQRPYQYLIGLNLRLPKFADPRVRQALNMAINRAAIVENVLKGSGAPSSGPIWYRHWAADSSAAIPYAPERARALFQESGLNIASSADPRQAPARLRITCLVPEGFIVYEHLALEVQRQLSDVGVDIRFDVQPVMTYEARLDARDFEAAMVDITSGFSLSRSSVFWRSPRRADSMDSFGYENPETESLFEELRAATSDATVRSVTQRLQDAFRRNPPAIFLAWNERARTFRGDFQIKTQPGTDPLPRLWEWGAQLSEPTAAR